MYVPILRYIINNYYLLLYVYNTLCVMLFLESFQCSDHLSLRMLNVPNTIHYEKIAPLKFFNNFLVFFFVFRTIVNSGNVKETMEDGQLLVVSRELRNSMHRKLNYVEEFRYLLYRNGYVVTGDAETPKNCSSSSA